MEQEIRLGYKKKKIGWIPKEWEEISLESLAEINPKRDPIKGDPLVSFLAMTDVSDQARIINQQIKKHSEVANGFTFFRDNDVIVAKITPCFENGKGALIHNLVNGIGFGSTEFHVLRANRSKIYPHFLFYHTVSDIFRKKGQKFMMGSAGQQRVPAEFLCSYRIPLPPLPEQNNIAQILSTWDKVIELMEKLISAKEQQKKALMQRLISDRLRFGENINTDWKLLPLSRCVMPVSREVQRPKTSFLALGIRSHGKGTFLKPDFDPSKISMETLYKVQKDDLIVNITFAWEGAIAIVMEQDDGALVSHRFPTYAFKRDILSPEYFKFYILQKRFIYELGVISPGGAGRNRVLDKEDFMRLKVTVPPVPEQKKIGSVLSACDKEIELLKKKLRSLKQEKKGLMQKLLTGKVRVKV